MSFYCNKNKSLLIAITLMLYKTFCTLKAHKTQNCKLEE